MNENFACKNCGRDLKEDDDIYCAGCQVEFAEEEEAETRFEYARDRQTELELAKRFP